MLCTQVPMLRSVDPSEEEGYEREENSFAWREDALAASATAHSMDGSSKTEGTSKAKVGQIIISLMCMQGLV